MSAHCVNPEIESFMCGFLENIDYEALSDFFLTFRSHMDCKELLEILCARFRAASGIGLEPHNRRVRIFVAVRHWILNYYPDDFLVSVSLSRAMVDFLNELGGRGADEITTEARIAKELRRTWLREVNTHRKFLASAEGRESFYNSSHRAVHRKLSRIPHQRLATASPFDDQVQPAISAPSRPVPMTGYKKKLGRGDHRHRSIFDTLSQANGAYGREAWETLQERCINSTTPEDFVPTVEATIAGFDQYRSSQYPSWMTRSSSAPPSVSGSHTTTSLQLRSSSAKSDRTVAHANAPRTLRRKPGQDLRNYQSSLVIDSVRSSDSTDIFEEPYRQYQTEDDLKINREKDDAFRRSSIGIIAQQSNEGLLKLLQEMLDSSETDSDTEPDTKSAALKFTLDRLEGKEINRKRKSTVDLAEEQSSETLEQHSRNSLSGSEKRRKRTGVARMPHTFVLPKIMLSDTLDTKDEREHAQASGEADASNISAAFHGRTQSCQKTTESLFANATTKDTGTSVYNEESEIDIVEALSIAARPLSSSKSPESSDRLLSPTWILECNTAHLAQALTTIEKSVFLELDWLELTSGLWIESINKMLGVRHWGAVIERQCIGLGVITARFNCFVSWITTKLLQIESLNDRVLSLVKFIEIAALCKNYSNYSSMMQIITALRGSAVQSLTKTWKQVPKESMKTWHSLVCLGDEGFSWHLLRNVQERALVNPSATVIPFMGTYLSDLLRIDQSNASFVSKMRETASITKVLLEMLERIEIDGTRDDRLIEKLVWVSGLDDATLLSLSKSRERI